MRCTEFVVRVNYYILKKKKHVTLHFNDILYQYFGVPCRPENTTV